MPSGSTTAEALNEGRGMNPGDTANLPRAWWPTTRAPLNEGRGMNPGDTCSGVSAGSTPATAQRRPGDEPRRHSRSAARRTPSGPLNEGRGMNPGDTGSARGRPLQRTLNEGRGMNPGDTANVKEQLAESDGNQNLPLDGRLLDIVHAPAQEKTRLPRDHRGLIPARRGAEPRITGRSHGLRTPKDLRVRGLPHDRSGCESRRAGPGSGRR